MIVQIPETYAVHIERRRPWLSVASVWWIRPEEDRPPVGLATVQALTRTGAKRRAARFVAQQLELAA